MNCFSFKKPAIPFSQLTRTTVDLLVKEVFFFFISLLSHTHFISFSGKTPEKRLFPSPPSLSKLNPAKLLFL